MPVQHQQSSTSRAAPARELPSLSRSSRECWVCDDGKAVRQGPPACLEIPARTMSVTGEQWHDWRQQQLAALSAAEEKAAVREEDAGAGSRAASQEQPRPRAASQPAEGSAGTGTCPLSFERRFVDRAALPKGVTFDPWWTFRVSVSTVTPLLAVPIAMVMPPCTMTPGILPAIVSTMTMPSHPVLSRRFGIPPAPPCRSSRVG